MTSQSKVLVLILILGMRAASNLNLIQNDQRKIRGDTKRLPPAHPQ